MRADPKSKRFPSSRRVTEAALKCSIAAAAVALARTDGQPMSLVRALDRWHATLMTRLGKLSSQEHRARARKTRRRRAPRGGHLCLGGRPDPRPAEDCPKCTD